MWAWAAAIAGAAVLAWQWAANRRNLPRCSELRARDLTGPCLEDGRTSEVRRPPAGLVPALNAANLRPSPELQRRLTECGVTAEDITIANRWTARFVGDVQPLRDRLEQMQNIMPETDWPPAALRVWCAFR